jgi:hypothetical protein
LSELLSLERGVRNKTSLSRLTRRQILAWADAFFRRHGKWPSRKSGVILEAPEESWNAVDAALRYGFRGLCGGSSLAKLLAECRYKRNHKALQPLSYKKILAWADSHFERTGKWPTEKSGPVQEQPTETWQAIASALRCGGRGLPGGSSLTLLLARKRGAPRRGGRAKEQT